MYEPKYKLNKKDAARWHVLLTRHCLMAPQAKPNKKYPPLTVKEQAEFERLDRKRHRKICAVPKVKASIAYGKRQIRKVDRLMAKLKTLVPQLNETTRKS